MATTSFRSYAVSRTAVAAIVAVSGWLFLPAFARTAQDDSGAHSTVIFVSRHGHDSASGSRNHPLRSVQAAIDRSTSGGTVIVRKGSYHESLTISGRSDLTIKAARRGTVWIDGSSRVRRWHRDGRLWVRSKWHHEFDSSPTFNWGAPDNPAPHWGFINPAHPMAAHPDQVFRDGRPLRQAASLDSVRKHSFFVDYQAHKLYLAKNPHGHHLRASTLVKAITIESPGVEIDGINARRYAPSVPNMGAITVMGSDAGLRHMVVRNISTTGVFVGATHARLDHMAFVHNGLLGFMATRANGLRVNRVHSAHNNAERFNVDPAAGGAKIGQSQNVTVRNSRFTHNHASGLWFDASCYKVRVIRSRFLSNAGNGISVEISGHALLAGNVISGNAGNGVKINDSDHVRLWNNTLVGNVHPIAVLQDNRDVDPGQSYHDPSLPLPWVVKDLTTRNNIVARASRRSSCLLCLRDYTHRFSASQLAPDANGDVLQRIDRNSPATLVIWPGKDAMPVSYRSLSAFKRATGQEQSHLSLVGVAAVTRTYRATARVLLEAASVAQPLPARIARLAHRTVGERSLGAWFGR